MQFAIKKEMNRQQIILKIKLDIQFFSYLRYKTLKEICPEAIKRSGKVDEDKLEPLLRSYWFQSPERLKYEGRPKGRKKLVD